MMIHFSFVDQGMGSEAHSVSSFDAKRGGDS